MCLAFFSVNVSKRYPMVIAFNRDEVYSRPTRSLHWWEDCPWILGGRDLQRGGSWAGVTREGRAAFLTFVRTEKSGSGERSKRSRGQIVFDYLHGTCEAEAYLEGLKRDGSEYLPYNVVLGDLRGCLYHFSNVEQKVSELSPGVHGLSNASLNTPWPKVSVGIEAFSKWSDQDEAEPEQLFEVMRRGRVFPDELLPHTGVTLRRERVLSSLFVRDGDYGTRTSTLLTLSDRGWIEVTERTHTTPGDEPGECRMAWTL